ncbi:RNase H domain-containing protein [Trichonephila clavipes]|nr:RNase H domain-containing protein [Trichonephila clavipes]
MLVSCPGPCTIWRPETQNSAFLLYPLHGRLLQDPTSLVQRSSKVQNPAPSARFPRKQSVVSSYQKSRNATPTEITDDEDMITYDVEEEELEQDPFILPEEFPSRIDFQQGFRYRVLLATKSRRNHRQRASGQRGKVGDDASAASGSGPWDMKRVIMHHIFKIWQESWSEQLDNKLHSVKPVIGAWPVMPMRRTDVKLTRLRIGHTRLTHRHLLFGERAPECPSCHVSYTVHHILIDCPVFNNYRITFFNSSHLTLPDLVGEIPHQNIFAFSEDLDFYI